MAAASWRGPHPGKQMTTGASPPSFQQSLGHVPAAACAVLYTAFWPSAGQTADSSHGGKMVSRLYILPQLFTAWCNLKSLSLNSCKIAAAYFFAEGQKMGPNPNPTKVSRENTNCCCFFKAFQENQVSISWSFLHISQVLFTILPTSVIS